MPRLHHRGLAGKALRWKDKIKGNPAHAADAGRKLMLRKP